MHVSAPYIIAGLTTVKVCKTVVRPAMMYGRETWAVKKAQEKKLDLAEMRMLRWTSGVTKLDRIRNERISGTTKVGEIAKKVQESRLKWYGHVLRREDEYVAHTSLFYNKSHSSQFTNCRCRSYIIATTCILYPLH